MLEISILLFDLMIYLELNMLSVLLIVQGFVLMETLIMFCFIIYTHYVGTSRVCLQCWSTSIDSFTIFKAIPREAIPSSHCANTAECKINSGDLLVVDYTTAAESFNILL